MSDGRKELLIVRKGILGPRARTELRREGFLVIEADDPGSVRRLPLEASPRLPADALILALLEAAIAYPSSTMPAVDALAAIVKVMRQDANAAPSEDGGGRG